MNSSDFVGKYLSFCILPEYEVILCNLQGKIQLSDLIDLNIRFISDPLYHPSYNVILDFRESLTIGYRIDVAEYINFFRKSVKLKKIVKVGILYTTTNQEFLFNIYKAVGKLVKLDVELFKKIDACLQWIAFSPEGQLVVKDNFLKIKAKEVS